MILTRIGNKSKIAKKIQAYFPPHKMYVEPFFGAGGMFFNKPKAQYNILNDNDSDVFNLFQVVTQQADELERLMYQMPIHQDLLRYWKKHKEDDPVRKALRFLLLSNFTYLGKPETLSFEAGNPAKIIRKNIRRTQEKLLDCQFMNVDFRDVLRGIHYRKNTGRSTTFVYCDPPYLDTTNNYSTGFSDKDTEDLFLALIESETKFAVSEFDHPKIIELAQRYNLNTYTIGERQTLKNRRTEILVTNYDANYGLFSE